MNKGVKQVRKSINQRKNIRAVKSKGVSKRMTPSFPQEEEKHGYYPIFPENTQQQKDNNSSVITGIMLKGILSVVLFFGVAFLFQTDSDLLKKTTEWTSNALTEEFPFARVNHWYQETFGSPFAFTPNQDKQTENGQQLALPVSGNVTESFQANGSGIMIAPEDTADISVMREGVVIFAGNDPETDKTVVVQHADGSLSSYGFLSEIDVHLYQFVSNNEQLGSFIPNKENKTVFFAIEKDNQYVDPVQVIKVDDPQ